MRLFNFGILQINICYFNFTVFQYCLKKETVINFVYKRVSSEKQDLRRQEEVYIGIQIGLGILRQASSDSKEDRS